MKIILHIGTEKTGTTSIQRFCARNREALRRRGYFFPTSPGESNHTKLAAFAANEGKCLDLRKPLGVESTAELETFREEFMSVFRAELAACGTERVILSNEHASSRLGNPEEQLRLRDFLMELADEVEIVVYLRRQDDFLLSSYSTAVKRGETEPLQLPNDVVREHRFNYHWLLKRWSQSFEQKPTVRVFDPAELTDGDVVADFLGVLGLENSSEFERVERTNESLDLMAIEFLRELNRFLPKAWDQGGEAARANLIPLLQARKISKRLTSWPELDEFYASFADKNRKVANHYLGSERLFPERPNEALSEHAKLDLDTAFEVFAELWKARSAIGES